MVTLPPTRILSKCPPHMERSAVVEARFNLMLSEGEKEEDEEDEEELEKL